jgi:digeranylgeranylglycerophospholipid reductase
LYDVIIIGGGPCGSRIARSLSRQGYRVAVVEKNARVGDDICCTGIISQECLSAFGFENGLILRQVNSAKLLSPSGKCLRVYREAPVAAIVDRPRLDVSLAKQAEAAGADYLFGAMAADISPDPDAVRVRINGQHEETVLKAEVAIIATGFGSPLPARLNLGEVKRFGLGAQAEVDTKGVNEVEVYFDQNLAPATFAWLVPTSNGRGLAGLLSQRQANGQLQSFLDSLSRQGKIASSQVPHSQGLIPLKPLPKTYADRVLVVGEAAGQVKPTSGGGIYYGLLCADIAAEVVSQAFSTGDFSAAALSAYQKRWRARLNRELTIDYWARALFARLSNKHIDYLFRRASQKGVSELIAASTNLSFDWHSRILLKLAWRLMPSLNGSKSASSESGHPTL